jgi:hypothetical protein
VRIHVGRSSSSAAGSCGGCPARAVRCWQDDNRPHCMLGPAAACLRRAACTHIPPCWRGWGSWVSCLQRQSCGPNRHSSPVRGWSGHQPAGALPGQQQPHLQQHAAGTAPLQCGTGSIFSRIFKRVSIQPSLCQYGLLLQQSARG